MFEDISYDSILESMLENVPSDVDKREGSIIFDALSPAALELADVYIYLDIVLNNSFADTAEREYLILRAKERGLSPYEATAAVLKLEVTYTGDSENVSAGDRFSYNGLIYTVTEQMENDTDEDITTYPFNGEESVSEPGEVIAGWWKVQCETAGTEGNSYFGSVVPVETISELKTAEITELLIPGEDEESTEDFRERYFDSINSNAFGGNKADYINWVNAIDGVGGTKAARVWNGDISPTDLIPSDTVSEWYEDVIDELDSDVKSWLTAVYTAAAEKKLVTGGTVLITIINSEYAAASDELVESVQEELDPADSSGEGYGIAPIGHVVTVQSVTEVSVTVTTEITFESGYSWSNMTSAIESAVESYFVELRQAWASSEYLVVRISQIENCILNLSGVIDITGTKLNNSESNISLGKYEIPVLGGVSE